jgi:hypothetical protein
MAGRHAGVSIVDEEVRMMADPTAFVPAVPTQPIALPDPGSPAHPIAEAPVAPTQPIAEAPVAPTQPIANDDADPGVSPLPA